MHFNSLKMLQGNYVDQLLVGPFLIAKVFSISIK